MNLFNNKKLKEKDLIIEDYRKRIQVKNEDIRKNNIEIKTLTKDNSELREHNTKLIEWILKILEINGTIQVNNIDMLYHEQFRIPVKIEKISNDYLQEGNFTLHEDREDIYIPAIHITKIRRRNDIDGI